MKTRGYYRKEYERKLHQHFGLNVVPGRDTRIREAARHLADGNWNWYEAVKWVGEYRGGRQDHE